MQLNKDFIRKSTESIIRYSLAQLIFFNSDDSQFYKLDRLNNTTSGKIARSTLINKNIIQMKSNFSFDKLARLNHDIRKDIEAMGIDTFIGTYLMDQINRCIELMEIEDTSGIQNR